MPITYEDNLKNVERCPRFQGCDIPKCPLDFYMSDRVELPEDERCILRGERRSNRVKGIRSAGMRGISKFIRDKKKKQ